MVLLQHFLHVLDLVAVYRFHMFRRVAHGDDPIVNVRKIQIEAILGIPDSTLAHEYSYGISHLDRRQSVGHKHFQPPQMEKPRPGAPYFGWLVSLFFFLNGLG